MGQSAILCGVSNMTMLPKTHFEIGGGARASASNSSRSAAGTFSGALPHDALLERSGSAGF